MVRFVSVGDDEAVRRRWARWSHDPTELVAPMLIRCEVTNALHRLRAASGLSEEVTREALSAAPDLPVTLADDPDLHPRAFALAGRFRLPAAYDAHYLALAEREGADLWTTDRRLSNAVRDTFPWVHLVATSSGAAS